jgi:prevent-host-death family protein
MKFATVRMLKNRTSEMLRVAARGTDVLITLHGRPVAVLHGIGEDDIEDFVLRRHAGMRRSIEDAWRDYRKRGGATADEVLLRLGARGGRRARARRA